MILEGIVTTLNDDGTPNVAPMGPLVDDGITRLVLRPYQTSRTYRNLKRSAGGVFHITDDVELLAHAATNTLHELPALVEARSIPGFILVDACRWYAFRVRELEDAEPRTTIHCEVIDQGYQRDFIGFNRAKHAVLEAAILATRIGILPAAQIADEMRRLESPVEKTGGEQERRAFAFLREYIRERLPGTESLKKN